MVIHRTLSGCPVTIQDVYNSLSIFGPGLLVVRGKTVRCIPETVDTAFLYIPKYFYALDNFFTLTANVMFMNGGAFLYNRIFQPNI